MNDIYTSTHFLPFKSDVIYFSFVHFVCAWQIHKKKKMMKLLRKKETFERHQNENNTY